MDDIKIRLALDGADQVQAGARKAADGLNQLGAAGAKAGQQTQLSGQQLAQVSAQLQDFFVQIQGGQAPLTALLQQGSQLSAVFGGVGNAVRAVASLITPTIAVLGTAAATVGVLAKAYNDGASEAQAYTRALVLTGNAAGVTVGQLQAMARAQAAVVGTQGDAAKSLAALAATGQVSAESLSLASEAATKLARVGIPLDQVVKKFAELGKDPLKAIVDLNEAENFLTDSVYKQVKALTEQGRLSDAANVAQAAYATATQQRADKIVQSLGTLERAWIGVKDTAASAWDKMLNVGRAATTEDQLAGVQAQIAAAQAKIDAARNGSLKDAKPWLDTERVAAAQERLVVSLQSTAVALAKKLDVERLNATAEADSAQAAKDRIKWMEEGEKYLTKEQQLQRETARIRQLGAAAGAKQAEIEARIVAARAKYADSSGDNELAGLRAKLKETNAYIDALNRQGPAVREANEGEKAALRLQEELKGALSASTRAEKEKALALATTLGQRQRLAADLKGDIETTARYTAELGQQADAIRQKAADQEAANAVYGQGKSAIEALTLAQAKKQALDLEATDNVDPKYLASLHAKIEAQERYVQALRAADFKQINAGLEEWNRSAAEQARLFSDDARLAGLSRLEREKIIAARNVELKLAKELAAIDRSDLDSAQKEALRIKARAAAEIESSNAVAKVVRDDWDRTADQIQQSLTDALISGGKSGADYIKSLFRAMVLRPVVSAIVQPFAGSVAGTIGGLLGQGGGIGGGLGGLGGANLLLDKLGLSGVASTIASVAGPLASIYNLSQGKYATAFGSGIGSVLGGLPGLAVGNFIGSALDKVFSGGAGTPHLGADYVSTATGGYRPAANEVGIYSAGASVNQNRNQSVEDALKALTGTGAGLLNGLATAFGKQANYAVGGYFAADGHDPAQANTRITAGGQTISNTATRYGVSGAKEGLDAFTAELAGQVRAALRSMDIPAWARGELDALANSAGFEELANAVQSIATTNTALKQLTDLMPQLGNLTGEAVSDLLKAMGGIEGLSSSVTAYYDAFYTEAEKNARATQSLGEAMGKLGLQVPTTREAFRKLVEAQDLTTESGRSAYAELLKLSPAFAALVPAAAELGQAADSSAADVARAAEKMAEAGRRALSSLADEQASLQVDLLRAQGNLTSAADLARQQALAKLTDGLSSQDAAAATAAYDFNAALRQQIDALTAAKSAAEQAAQAEAQRVAAVTQQRDGIQAQIDQLLGDTAAVRARELSGIDETNRALQQRFYALQDEAAAAQAAAQAAQELAARQSAVAQQRESIQAQIDQLLGDTAAVRSRELAGLDASNRALQERYYALQDEAAAAQAASQAAQDLAAKQAAVAQQREGIQGQIDQLTGNTAAIRARELASIDETNRALQERLYALQDEATAAQSARQAAQELAAKQAAVAQQREGIQARIDELTGNTAAIRARELSGLDESNRALQERVYALQDEAAAAQAASQAAQAAAQAAQELAARQSAIAQQREGIQAQIDQLLGDTVAIRARELAGLDETNRALQERLYALQDEAAAAKDAAQAAQELAAKQAAVAQQRAGIQSRIDELTGDTAAIRARELAGLDESNRALQEQYYALLDAKAAAEQAAQAQAAANQEAERAAQAAEQVRNAWRSVSDSLLEEVARLRGDALGQGAAGLSAAQARFAITTAQARAGDQDAAKLLPSLSRNLLELVSANARSRSELDKAQAQVAASLEGTATLLGGMFGFSVRAGASAQPLDVQGLLREVVATAPIVSGNSTPQQAAVAAQAGMADLVDEVRALRAENSAMRDLVQRIAVADERTRDVLVNVTEGGRAMQVENAS